MFFQPTLPGVPSPDRGIGASAFFNLQGDLPCTEAIDARPSHRASSQPPAKACVRKQASRLLSATPSPGSRPRVASDDAVPDDTLVRLAVATVLADPAHRTADLGGPLGTADFTDLVIAALPTAPAPTAV